nr:class E sortase [Actinomyces culturomici]
MTVPMTRAAHARRRAKPSVGAVILGVVGELLITAALVLAGFAFWQLYWTSFKVEGPRAQAVATYAQAHEPVTKSAGETRTDDPPAFAQGPGANEIYGLIHVPSWNWMRIPLAETTSTFVLDNGYAGHYEESAQVGEIGNFSVAGHRRTYGNNFRWIDRLKEGDPVVVEVDDYYVVYKVASYEIVDADDPTNIRVVAPVIGDLTWSQTPTERWMTMTTCHPEYGNSQRYIVHLKFASWTPKSSGVPAELVDEPTA